MKRRTLVIVTGLAVVCPAARLGAQSVKCDLTKTDGTVVGNCLGFLGTSVHVSLAPTDSNADWSGNMEFDGHTFPFSVAPYQYSDGPKEVVRTPSAWFLPSVLNLDGNPPRLSWSMSAEAPPSKTDLAILDRAREVLHDKSVWNRADNRVCHASDTTFSLYCALEEAVRQLTGRYQHRQPALQVVRRVVERRFRDRVVRHRLMDFNNDPATTFADISAVFKEARRDLVKIMR